jgi:membrane protein DedA with SNARE-associated domain
MGEWLDTLLNWLASAPHAAIYAVLGFAAALENVIPPVPADVVVVFGGVLAGRGGANPWGVFLAVWLFNVAGALFVYLIGRRYGAAFFAGRWGQMLLRPHQLEQLDGFYHRFGTGIIFVSRFLPMLRAVVPVFAGVSRLGVARTAVPIAAASALWYGGLVYLGTAAGRNWHEVMATLDHLGRWFWLAALLLLGGVAAWWWRSR